MPTIQGSDDFNHVIDAAHYDAYFADGANDPESVGSPVYQAQPASLLIHSEGSVTGVRKNITGLPTLGWCAFPFQHTGATGNDVQISELRDAGGSVARLFLNASNELYASISGVFGTESNCPASVWHWIEMILDVSGGTHTLYWRINGVDGDSVDFAAAVSSISWSQLLSNSGNGTANWYAGWWAWGTASSPTDWLGVDFLTPAPIDRRMIRTSRGTSW
jgi:hypothetical protein